MLSHDVVLMRTNVQTSKIQNTTSSLFQYRDCVSRVVLDRCADSSPTAVEILMGVRRREMTLTCRGFNRDVCSGSIARTVLNLPFLITFAILASFMTLKQLAKSDTILV